MIAKARATRPDDRVLRASTSASTVPGRVPRGARPGPTGARRGSDHLRIAVEHPIHQRNPEGYHACKEVSTVMDSDFHFGPARSGEATAYGARTPAASLTGIREWADFMLARGVTRVCCLLDAGQLAGFPLDLETEYKKLFGATCVLMEAIADHHLCSLQALRGSILPFLRAADAAGDRVVIHCWGGNGRVGHVLAAWLVAARGLSPTEALEAVEATGRLPHEAVLAGNARMDELIELLAGCERDRRS